ncbi:hypothetical protein L13192_10324 [Pyrenophora tritici-repentis]|uniref:Uncharacterized protein n=2 Tax=Pyrenophora tritici-repentis TaxID=45151 RepID=A0A922SZ26_9PLEO|nr:uncharacterized protein PTRG_06452 [Pyrenophora tritici-repentis Pt-1C-BFP]EDU49372.1 predicted protein [Pyrenophora tritici-repentis Pt-1C-BFP]KAI1512562.1 hypothetical protein Ptr86124_008528 [Pyrenophora tritici-repentis]KAI1665383.1 hypothetical protein L13192_10324 [Pyrenophora tritici-repentis]KAI1677806.1 hypothetical protein KJE20_12742 [Pyrenophora tritici-repentis]
MRRVQRPVSYNLTDLQRANEGLPPVPRVTTNKAGGKKSGNNQTPATKVKKPNTKTNTKKPEKDKTKKTQTGRVEKVKANTKKKVAAGGKKGKKASPTPSTSEESDYDE